MKIYTKTGDSGETGLYSGERVHKTDLRISAIGCLDELNSALGLAVAFGPAPDVLKSVREIQNLVFRAGSDVATISGMPHLKRICAEDILRLESLIDEADGRLPELRAFILPGGTPSAAQLHVCRTLCRRAERAALVADQALEIRQEVPVLLNRLSDLLFMLARLQNHLSGERDPEWVPEKS